MIRSNKEKVPPFLSEIPFGLFVALLSPFAVLFAIALAVSFGLLYATHADELWAISSTRPLGQGVALLDDTTTIESNRSTCEGLCPEYSLKISGSGKVWYEAVTMCGKSRVRFAELHSSFVRHALLIHREPSGDAERRLGPSLFCANARFDFPSVASLLMLDLPVSGGLCMVAFGRSQQV